VFPNTAQGKRSDEQATSFILCFINAKPDVLLSLMLLQPSGGKAGLTCLLNLTPESSMRICNDRLSLIRIVTLRLAPLILRCCPAGGHGRYNSQGDPNWQCMCCFRFGDSPALGRSHGSPLLSLKPCWRMYLSFPKRSYLSPACEGLLCPAKSPRTK